VISREEEFKKSRPSHSIDFSGTSIQHPKSNILTLSTYESKNCACKL
jgi:hypothetical protein